MDNHPLPNINLERQRKAHISYGNERWALLTKKDKGNVTYTRKWEGPTGPERGVAGIERYETVRCLHAHAAHYLAGCGCGCGCGMAAAAAEIAASCQNCKSGSSKNNGINNDGDTTTTTTTTTTINHKI